MKKSKRRFQGASERKGNSRGITLVALVITIIIIIILATVTINFAFGDSGLIKQAELARDLTANSTEYESQAMSNLVAYMNEILEGTGNPPDTEETVKLVDVKGGEAFDKKTTVEDEEGNKIEVPAGFKIASDSGNTVQQGVVIEDVNASTDEAVQGSQFVWIPVGKFIKDDGTESNEIILGRYTFADDAQGTPTLQQAAYTEENPENYKNSKVIEERYDEYSGSHRDGIASSGLDGLNATANDLGAWIDSVKTNGGYYIGRYEASFASGTSVDNYKAATKVSEHNSKSSMSYNPGTLWNYITQLDASKVAINTYEDSGSVKSDLMNSYAWDTAIVYIQECGNTNYANQDGKSTNNNLTDTGTGQDEVCKINDMASNIAEWTTEYSSSTYSSSAYPCTLRGGNYYDSNYYTASRDGNGATDSYGRVGFRLSLYM